MLVREKCIAKKFLLEGGGSKYVAQKNTQTLLDIRIIKRDRNTYRPPRPRHFLFLWHNHDGPSDSRYITST